MELVHEFTVAVPVEQAWDVLTDVARIAPCMPGAELTEVDGGTYHGQVKIKVGPITAQYKGTASFAEKDEAARRVVLQGLRPGHPRPGNRLGHRDRRHGRRGRLDHGVDRHRPIGERPGRPVRPRRDG